MVLTLNVNPIYSETITATICEGDSYILGTQTFTEAGTYTEVFTSQSGCASTVILSISIKQIDKTVTFNGSILIASEDSASYQWIDYGNGNVPIPGETNRSFTPSRSGEYAVNITKNGCSVKSNCMMAEISIEIMKNEISKD